MNWRKTACVLAWIVSLIGAVGFSGWLFDVEALKRVHPSFVTMKVNTALCLMLSGVAVWLLREEGGPKWRRRSAWACAGFVALVGALSFAEHAGGWDFGIDQLLFAESATAAGNSFPGRMGPASALIFVLFALGAFVLDAPGRGWRPAQLCACGMIAATLGIFLAYFYRVELPAWLIVYASIALHTVVAFWALAASLLLIRPDRGVMVALLANDSGGLAARRMLPAALLIPALFGWLTVLGRDSGLYGRGVGIALLATICTVMFTALIWWTARAMGEADVQRRAAEDNLRRRERQLADFFDSAAVPLHWIGPDGLVLRVNDAELQMLGYSREEVVGRHIAEFHADPPVIDGILRRLAAREVIRECAARLRCKDGSLRHVMIDSSVYSENGEFIHTRCFTRDVTEIQRMEAARSRLAAIVDSSEEPIFSTDLDGTVTSWNNGAERLFGFSAEEILASNFLRLVPPELHTEERTVLQRLRAGERVASYESERVTKEGRRLLVCVTVSGIRDAEGATVGISRIARDITEQKRAEESLRAANLAAEAANRAKDDFLAALSHELRTPLTPVLLVSTARETEADLPDDVRRDFAMIRKSIDLEARIIDDLLDLTRITQRKLVLTFETIQPRPLIEHTLEILSGEIAAKKLRLELDLAAATCWMRADPVRLQQVFWNILKNAVKFTPNGGLITVRSWSEAERFHLCVKDTGIGVSPSEMPRLFEAFAQGENAARFGGLGLGLSISAVLMREHGGRIWVESAGRNQGAEFYLDLPLTTATGIPPSRHDAPSLADGQAWKILLVEDHATSRETLARLLAARGHNVQVAESKANALVRAREERFDFVISDIGLPDGNGYELMETLHRDLGLRGIALTGYGMEADVEHSARAGFSEHLTKPIDISEVERAIARLTTPRPHPEA